MNKYTIYTISATGLPKKVTTIVADSYASFERAQFTEFYETIEEPRFARSSLKTQKTVATLYMTLDKMMIVQDDKKGE